MSVLELANNLEREQVEAYQAKVTVSAACIKAFGRCLSSNSLIDGPERHFAEKPQAASGSSRIGDSAI